MLEGNLSKTGAEQIKAHLDKCANCAKEYKEMKQVLGLVSQKKGLLEPSGQFWTNFNQELNERLAQEKVLPQEVKPRWRYLPQITLRPAFALGCVFVLLIALSFYLFGALPTKGRLIALSEDRLLNEIEMLEELTDEFVILDDEDVLLDELSLLEELG